MWRPVRNSYMLQLCQQQKGTLITVVGLAVLLLGFFIGLVTLQDDPEALPTLKHVHVIFRHGERTPVGSYPTDPHKDHKWFGGPGALTNKGKVRLFGLGEVMRYRYSKFFNDLYDPEEVNMESSGAPRCQMSAQLFMAGLYPPTGVQVWNEHLAWQPIPVNPIARAQDNKLAAKRACKAYDIAKEKSDENINKGLKAADKEVLEILSNYTGQSVTTISQVEFLYYLLRTQQENGLELPSWTKPIFPYRMASLAALNLASYTYTDEMKKLKAGPLLQEIVLHMKQHEHMPTMKGRFYSAHDLTIVTIARAFGYGESDLPFYGDSLILEYHNNDAVEGKGFVQLWYYRQATRAKFDQLKLPFCELDCPLETFANYLSKYIDWKEWDRECGNI